MRQTKVAKLGAPDFCLLMIGMFSFTTKRGELQERTLPMSKVLQGMEKGFAEDELVLVRS